MERQDDFQSGIDLGKELGRSQELNAEFAETQRALRRARLERRSLPGAAGLFELGGYGEQEFFFVGPGD